MLFWFRKVPCGHCERKFKICVYKDAHMSSCAVRDTTKAQVRIKEFCFIYFFWYICNLSKQLGMRSSYLKFSLHLTKFVYDWKWLDLMANCRKKDTKKWSNVLQGNLNCNVHLWYVVFIWKQTIVSLELKEELINFNSYKYPMFLMKYKMGFQLKYLKD